MQVPKTLAIRYLELGEYNEISYIASDETDGYVYMNNNMIECFEDAQLNYTNVKEISILLNNTPYTLYPFYDEEYKISPSPTDTPEWTIYGFERVNFNSDEPNQFYINRDFVESENSGTAVTIKFVSFRTDDAIYYVQ